jgi:hypothetical protein
LRRPDARGGGAARVNGGRDEHGGRDVRRDLWGFYSLVLSFALLIPFHLPAFSSLPPTELLTPDVSPFPPLSSRPIQLTFFSLPSSAPPVSSPV